MHYALKRLSPSGLDAALEKAERYRDLNQPEEAESICRDILDIDPSHQAGLRTLGLTLTDRFSGEWTDLFEEAQATFRKLEGEYERAYYAGIAWERLAKAQLEHHQARNALHSFEKALSFFQIAEDLAQGSSPDPVLRWNRCVRALTAHPALREATRAQAPAGFRYDD